jgi:hypothetical protein
VCSVCLDGTGDGTCRLTGTRLCAVDEYLPRLVAAVRDVRAGREAAYSAAVEARVCSECIHRSTGSEGCALRRDGRCALAIYLPLLVEAIERVDGGDDVA